MATMIHEFDAWFDAVLRRNRCPSWLTGEAPDSDVALSSRARFMRNLAGFPFPHRCTRSQLEEVQRLVREAALGASAGSMSEPGIPAQTRGGNGPCAAPQAGQGPFAERRNVSDAERAMLVGSRLVSPEFQWDAPGRSVFLNAERSVAIMVNEEDHLRIQAVTAGFSTDLALAGAESVEKPLGRGMALAKDAEFGYLAAWPPNAGAGRRLGAMLHLIGLAEAGRLQGVLEAAKEAGCEPRGLMGELSSGDGAFVQVSSTRRNLRELSPVLRHLIEEERKARAQIEPEKLKGRVEASLRRTEASRGLSLAQAVNCVAWLRLGAERGVLSRQPREFDALLALLSFGHNSEPATNLRRGRLMRRFVEVSVCWQAPDQ